MNAGTIELVSLCNGIGSFDHSLLANPHACSLRSRSLWSSTLLLNKPRLAEGFIEKTRNYSPHPTAICHNLLDPEKTESKEQRKAAIAIASSKTY